MAQEPAGTIQAWGSNQRSQLGDGLIGNAPCPNRYWDDRREGQYRDIDVYGRQCKPGSLSVVDIYWHEDGGVSLAQRYHAVVVATRVFRGIGVELDWRNGAGPQDRRSFDCASPEIIEVKVDATAGGTVTSGALAYSFPFRTSGIRVHLIHDRIAQISTNVPNVLGYVLAHEIGHVLQGVARHSDEGLLKGSWNGTDYGLMATLALTFSPEDAEMIRRHFSQHHRAMD